MGGTSDEFLNPNLDLECVARLCEKRRLEPGFDTRLNLGDPAPVLHTRQTHNSGPRVLHL